MELYFVADYELLGEIKTAELKPGGDDIKVNEENKHEYIECVFVLFRFFYDFNFTG
jgi:atrophin-1 interacting protein 5 (WW domain-containing E3 ubiquitin protein ligase 1)